MQNSSEERKATSPTPAHSAPFLDLLSNFATSILNQVVAFEEPASTPASTPASSRLSFSGGQPPDISSPAESPTSSSSSPVNLSMPSITASVEEPPRSAEPENFLSFMNDLIGFGGTSGGARKATNPVDIKHSSSNEEALLASSLTSEKSKTTIFDAADLEELGLEGFSSEDEKNNKIEDDSTREGMDILSQDDSQLYQPSLRAQEAMVKHEKPFLTSEIMEMLQQYLPPILRESSSITLLYSLEKDGISLHTLYHKTQDQGPCILAVKDTDGNIFGGFLSESLQVHVGFYGNGQCFLWKYNTPTNSVEVFRATGKNDYYLLSEPHCIAFGGGDGKFGLWIDNALFNGYSQHCETYSNTSLTTSEEEHQFSVYALEIWGFVS